MAVFRYAHNVFDTVGSSNRLSNMLTTDKKWQNKVNNESTLPWGQEDGLVGWNACRGLDSLLTPQVCLTPMGITPEHL